jgi:hypothetical protein
MFSIAGDTASSSGFRLGATTGWRYAVISLHVGARGERVDGDGGAAERRERG